MRRSAGGSAIDASRASSTARRASVGSIYDANVTGFDPYPSASPRGDFDDPMLDGARGAAHRATVDFYARDMGYRSIGRYELINGEVNRSWSWGGGQEPPESVGALREVVARRPEAARAGRARLRPISSRPTWNRSCCSTSCRPSAIPTGCALKVYPGGHMFYTRDASRAAFARDVKALYEAAVK